MKIYYIESLNVSLYSSRAYSLYPLNGAIPLRKAFSYTTREAIDGHEYDMEGFFLRFWKQQLVNTTLVSGFNDQNTRYI